jgi:ATP-binding protein involved in chromosome partitioning
MFKRKNRNEMPDLTKSGILSSLKKTGDSGFNTDLLILNSIKSFELKDNNLFLHLALPVTENQLSHDLIHKFEGVLKKDYPALKKIDIKLDTKSPQEKGSQGSPKPSMLPGVKYTVAVASGKGGVGKSTVAVNLAVAMAKTGARVGLIDADIYGPSIPLMLGINEKPRVYKVGDTMRMIPVENFGVKLMSIGFLVDDDTPVIWRGPMASGAVKQFMTDVEWDELDFLFFDMPPGTGDIQLTLVQSIPLSGAIIVTTPQEVSLIDARKGLAMFSRVNVPIYGIVENMSYFVAPDTGRKYDIFGSGGGEKLAKEAGIAFLGGIPIDPRIREGGDSGNPIVFGLKGTEYSDIMMMIANNLKDQAEQNSNENNDVEIIL